MKTVIEMAREAGIRSPDVYKLTVGHMSIDQLEHLAELVRADEREAAEERVVNLFITATIQARNNT